MQLLKNEIYISLKAFSISAFCLTMITIYLLTDTCAAHWSETSCVGEVFVSLEKAFSEQYCECVDTCNMTVVVETCMHTRSHIQTYSHIRVKFPHRGRRDVKASWYQRRQMQCSDCRHSANVHRKNTATGRCVIACRSIVFTKRIYPTFTHAHTTYPSTHPPTPAIHVPTQDWTFSRCSSCRCNECRASGRCSKHS